MITQASFGSQAPELEAVSYLESDPWLMREPALETRVSFGLAAVVIRIFFDASMTKSPVLFIHSEMASLAAWSIGIPAEMAYV